MKLVFLHPLCGAIFGDSPKNSPIMPLFHYAVHDFVNSDEGEVIFGAIFVQVGEIHAHLPFSILLLDHHNIF
jgi:hypothetical protein